MEATYVVAEHVLFGADFDGISDEAEDGAHPQQHRKAAKEVLAEFHPFRRRLGRCQGVGSVAFKDGLRLRYSQALEMNNNKMKVLDQINARLQRPAVSLPALWRALSSF